MILGYFDGQPSEPRVSATVVLPWLSRASPRVEFLIDTGATETVIHPLDLARRFLVDAEPGRPLEVGGRTETLLGTSGLADYVVVPVRFGFTHEDGRAFIRLGEIRLAQPTQTNLYLPSILGWDVLRYFAISLDWASRSVTLQPHA